MKVSKLGAGSDNNNDKVAIMRDWSDIDTVLLDMHRCYFANEPK
jgi:hypothetical protein